MVNNMFCDGAAEAVGRFASNLNGNAIEAMQKGFGHDTNVSLPGGHLFDARVIISNPNAHHNNNRLSSTGDVSSNPSAGMVDRLNPDYSALSEDIVANSRAGSTFV